MKNKNINKQDKNRTRIFYAVLVILFVAVAFGSYVLGLYKNNNIKTGQFSMLNPARAFTNQKDLIVNFQPLRDYLNDKYEADTNVSVYFEYLPTGASIAINKDAEFYPASLLKVPVAMAVAKKVERGDWKWTNELVLMSTDKDNKFGTLYKEPSNSTFTIEELVRRSLTDSDNTAHFILVRNLEMEEMKDVYDHMGLVGFLETEGSLSAKKYSVMVRALYSASYTTEENSQKLLSYLTQSPFSSYSQSGLPKGVSFAHKIGVDIDRKVFLDSGIVYEKNRPYILTIMTKNKGEQIATKMMADISEKVYNYVKEYEE
ncbi:MAG: Peptidoglycan-binding domain 1 protein [Parcubacteria group bacterium GW2011_GWA1_47_8]|nr:MAG: Peptidoglycan-binding domain 1 protein [Parcubacteria group bacterium GW2011_GWA1_47_8]